jgi:phosphonate transport system substrate-binding protein
MKLRLVASLLGAVLIWPLGVQASEVVQQFHPVLLAQVQKAQKRLVIGAIPDQDPEKLNRLYGKVAAYLSKQLGVPVTYKPVTDYAAAVTAFKNDDLDVVWFGGLTGVQARLQVPGARAIAQRDVDQKFTSVFIANRASGLKPIKSTLGLQQLKGKRFTFGPESSTSGRLMPQHYLSLAGVKLSDFRGGQPGFSKSHDNTVELVQSGTYQVGVLNEKVWQTWVESKRVDPNKVSVIWRTPPYYDYHWVANPALDERFGKGFINKVQAALLALNPKAPQEAEILALFKADKFIPTRNQNYAQIEKVGRSIGKIK